MFRTEPAALDFQEWVHRLGLVDEGDGTPEPCVLDRRSRLTDAAAFGIPTPRTVVTTRPTRRRPGGGACVVKAAGRYRRLDVVAVDLLVSSGTPMFLAARVDCDRRWFEHRCGDTAVSRAVASWVAARFEELLQAAARSAVC